MRNLHDHAEYELTKAGFFDSAGDYGGALGKAVMELVDVFSGQDHSGASAATAAALASKLFRGENLSPLSNDPSEWMDVSVLAGEPLWQNARNSAAFSKDGGKTFYLPSARPDSPTPN